MADARSIQIADAVLSELKKGSFRERPEFTRQIHPVLTRETLDQLSGIVTPRGDVRTKANRGRHRNVDYIVDVALFQTVDVSPELLEESLEPLVQCAEGVRDYMDKSERITLPKFSGFAMVANELSNGGTDTFWRERLESGNVFAWVVRLTYRGVELTG